MGQLVNCWYADLEFNYKVNRTIISLNYFNHLTFEIC